MRGALIAVALCACGGNNNGTTSGDDDAPPLDAPGTTTPTLRDKQRQLAVDLRGVGNFMVGIGNDNSGPYDHAISIDLHYAYLVGYGDQGGWPTWNTGGDYPKFFAQTAESHAATPMFTYYQLALELENHNDGVLNDATRMHQYLSDIRLMFAKTSDQPGAFQFEPDFFGYLMQRAAMGTGPDAIPAKVHFDDVPECAALPETASGLTHCIVKLARATAPMARIGFHASMWGAYYDPLDPNADIETSGQDVAAFLKSVGADQTDFVTVETSDRDAGFWETSGGGSTCSITGGTRGAVYWDEANVSLPNFSQHVRWVKALTAALNLPALEWQTPMGLPSPTCGGSNEHWRDNRVHYFFGHVAELAAAGVAGMAFGTGAGGQTNLATDGDSLKTSIAAYRAAPLAL